MNSSDASLFPTHHQSERELLATQNPYTLTRGDQVGILFEQLAESQRLLAEQRRLVQMLNDQLRLQREQRQLQEQPAPQPKKKLPGIALKG